MQINCIIKCYINKFVVLSTLDIESYKFVFINLKKSLHTNFMNAIELEFLCYANEFK